MVTEHMITKTTVAVQSDGTLSLQVLRQWMTFNLQVQDMKGCILTKAFT